MKIFRRILIGLGLTLLLLPAAAMAFGEGGSMTYSTDNGFHPGMLDASVPQKQRLQRFAHVIELAKQGDVRAQDLAGTMYWQGSRIKGSPIQSNTDQAHILLANAAVHGDVLAMAKMAELQLAQGHAGKAMVWAQLYAHYINPNQSQRHHRGPEYAYASDLIGRIGDAGGKGNKKVSAEVNGMVTKFDKQIRAGILKFKKQERSGKAFLTTQPAGSAPAELRTKSGVAEYMVAFQPSGAPGKVWLIASWPTAEFGTDLRDHIDHAQANRVDAGVGTRYMLVPVVHYSNRFRQLRTHH